MRTAFRALTSVFFAAVVIQIGFAAYGAFNAGDKADGGSVTEKAIEDGFSAHAVLGTAIIALALVLVVVAYFARSEAGYVNWSAILFVLTIVQMVLAFGGDESAWIGFLHGVNALAIYALAAMLAHRVWSEKRAVPSVE
jgi:Family of unknown function (DUF6220)